MINGKEPDRCRLVGQVPDRTVFLAGSLDPQALEPVGSPVVQAPFWRMLSEEIGRQLGLMRWRAVSR